MDPREVEKLREAYNEEHPDEPNIGKGPNAWQEITRRLKDECNAKTANAQRACVVHSLVKKPAAPQSWEENGAEWLSSDDIDMSQKYYEKLVPSYYYVGSVPIDFDKKAKTGKCLVSSLCSLNIAELYKKGYRSIGVVFNTDTSDGPGEHWMAAFADIRSQTPHMSFFDSYGQTPEKEVVVLMNRWKEQYDKMPTTRTPMKLFYNKVKHQTKDSQCGMYSIYFLYCSIFEIPIERRIPDDVVEWMRHFFFRYKQRRSKK